MTFVQIYFGGRDLKTGQHLATFAGKSLHSVTMT